ncbi:hypothetical protein NPX13_g10321 [Xylaria arbuscula]|uniref:Uncharacterized protein n=1 Tax=Xylaria arbuscula TaxID=114810 RepID=A0A9W8N512_9PEZI|nr:hypothetical protein NPX13_g10321 [Xylaria arbuscula]
MTGLYLAAFFGLNKAAASLLGGCKTDIRNSSGWTPLFWAAENGHEATVKLPLTAKVVDPDSKDVKGWTPLSRAASRTRPAQFG